jgi:hypothetical protein
MRNQKKLPLPPQRTTTGFAFSNIERALQECLANRQFGQYELTQTLKFFEFNTPECVYCGSTEINRWDHLVAVKNGGETVLGNMVPACSKCDDSKRDLLFDSWMQSDHPGSPKSRGIADIQQRIERIKSYVRHFTYQVRPLETRLTPVELRELEKVRYSIQNVRQDCEKLIASFTTRINMKE